MPDHVTLIGASTDPSPDNGIFSEDGAAVTLGYLSSLINVHVSSSGHSAVVGGDYSFVSDLYIDVVRGAGLVVSDGQLHASRVTIVGAVDDPSDPRFTRVQGFRVVADCPSEEDDCACQPGDVDGERVCDVEGQWATWTSTYGLYAHAAYVEMEDVHISRMARAGVVMDDSMVRWDGGSIVGTLGAGGVSRGRISDALFTNVRIEGTTRGHREERSYGWIASDNFHFTAGQLVLTHNDGVGLFASDTRIAMGDVVIEEHGDVGLWLIGNDYALHELSVTRCTRAGVAVFGPGFLDLEGATVVGTRAAGSGLGDGLLIVDAETSIRDVTSADNARGGLVFEWDVRSYSPEVAVDIGSEGTFGAAAVERSGEDFVITNPTHWDVAIERSAPTAEADAALSGAIDVLEAEPSDWRTHLSVQHPFL